MGYKIADVNGDRQAGSNNFANTRPYSHGMPLFRKKPPPLPNAALRTAMKKR
jgi:hypothetical protein